MSEKRKYIRFNASFLFTLDVPGKPQTLEGIVQDISMGGARVAFDNVAGLVVGDITQCYLKLPGQTYEVTGQVAWMRSLQAKHEAGFSFVQIPDYYKEDIYTYIVKYYRRELTQKWWQM